jgi:hypothetical protein
LYELNPYVTQLQMTWCDAVSDLNPFGFLYLQYIEYIYIFIYIYIHIKLNPYVTQWQVGSTIPGIEVQYQYGAYLVP